MSDEQPYRCACGFIHNSWWRYLRHVCPPKQDTTTTTEDDQIVKEFRENAAAFWNDPATEEMLAEARTKLADPSVRGDDVDALIRRFKPGAH